MSNTTIDFVGLGNYELTTRLMLAVSDNDYDTAFILQDEILRRLGTPFGDSVFPDADAASGVMPIVGTLGVSVGSGSPMPGPALTELDRPERDQRLDLTSGNGVAVVVLSENTKISVTANLDGQNALGSGDVDSAVGLIAPGLFNHFEATQNLKPLSAINQKSSHGDSPVVVVGAGTPGADCTAGGSGAPPVGGAPDNQGGRS